MERPRIAIVCAFYYCRNRDRRDITSRIFKHYSSVPDSVFIGVGSEGHVSKQVLEDANPNAEYHEFFQNWTDCPPNGHEGLRSKYNFAVEAARAYDPDVVFCLGSDDLFPHALFTPPAPGKQLVATGQGERGGAFFWKHDSRDAFWWDGRSPFGDARGKFCGGVLGFSPELLDDLDWAPWQFPGDEVGLEAYVHDTYGADALEPRYGMPAWHPKTTAALNDMTLIETNLTLEPVGDDVLQPFLDYWGTLAPSEGT